MHHIVWDTGLCKHDIELARHTTSLRERERERRRMEEGRVREGGSWGGEVRVKKGGINHSKGRKEGGRDGWREGENEERKREGDGE